MISCVGKILCRSSTGCFSISDSALCAALAAISRGSCLIVVRPISRANVLSSKPIIEISSGTDIPVSLSLKRKGTAIESWWKHIAVGGVFPPRIPEIAVSKAVSAGDTGMSFPFMPAISAQAWVKPVMRLPELNFSPGENSL